MLNEIKMCDRILVSGWKFGKEAYPINRNVSFAFIIMYIVQFTQWLRSECWRRCRTNLSYIRWLTEKKGLMNDTFVINIFYVLFFAKNI